MSTGRVFIAMAAATAVLAAACGGSSEDGPTNSETGKPTATATATAEDSGVGSGLGAATDVASARAAVVRIVSEGSFIDPEVGLQLNTAGSGSGFIIDPSGIAVTNNHVVTGSALLRVYVEGEDDPRNARILGVSECNDLAVIDIEGDDLPWLDWREDSVGVGLEVFAAGFPLGDPEFTLTRGIVSKEKADGETSWASVDDVIEHDATINPGNSGGPLLDEDGRVVGANYAGSSSSSQYFAISQDTARPIIEQLRAGEDVTSIGVNGEAVLDEEQGIAGIWVASVQSGSPAAEAGVKAGDIVTKLEGLVLSTDGTMADYCDVLRSHDAGDVLAIEVLRYATEEVLEGELNGDELVQSFSFRQELDSEVAAETGGSTTDTYASYTAVSDDTGTISVEVPSDWTDTDGAINENFGPSIYASTNLQAFLDTWDTPGVAVEYSADMGAGDIGAVLDQAAPSDCISQGRDTYEDPLYSGEFEYFTDCGGTDTVFLTVAATPEDGSYLIRVFVQAVEPRDLDAMDQILNTFVVTG